MARPRLGHELAITGVGWWYALTAPGRLAGRLLEIAMMALNNTVYLVFWLLYFGRFRQVNQWRLNDLLVLFGIVAVGSGLATYLCGGLFSVAHDLTNGNLDEALVTPRDPLTQVLTSAVQPAGLGDALFGAALLVIAVRGDPVRALMVPAAIIVAGVVYVSYLVLVQAAAAWAGDRGRSGAVAAQSLYVLAFFPGSVLSGPSRLLLYTLVPAGLFATTPAQAVHDHAPWLLLWSCVGAAALLVAARLVFAASLRRYESMGGMLPGAR